MKFFRGTLHLAINGMHKALVTADSRGIDDSGETHNDFQKLFQAGQRTVCAIGGIVNVGPDWYGADSVARRVSAICARHDLADRPGHLLEAVRDAMWNDLRRVLCHEAILFNAFAFRKDTAGKVDLLELEFLTEEVDGQLRLCEPTIEAHAESVSARFAFSIGHGDCLTAGLEQCCNPDTLEDSAAVASIDRIYAAARSASTECGCEVGGPIDIAAIDRTGVRWLRRKPGSYPETTGALSVQTSAPPITTRP